MLLFPTDSLEKSQVERDYQTEYEAAQKAGFHVALFDFDALTHDESLNRVLRFLPPDTDSKTCFLRSWMMRVEDYARLENGIKSRGITLGNSAEAYQFCHHLPENYPLFEGATPRSVWVERSRFERGDDIDFDAIFEELDVFGGSPIILKDYVKSQKHHWKTACFIERANDKAAVEKVVRRFLELQGDFLVGGLVFREFVELCSIGNHPQSGMPLAAEWRVFWADKQPILIAPYWAGTELNIGETPDVSQFQALANQVPSRFWTMDLAQKQDGEWIVVELGDGQVAGLPSLELAEDFHAKFASVFNHI